MGILKRGRPKRKVEPDALPQADDEVEEVEEQEEQEQDVDSKLAELNKKIEALKSMQVDKELDKIKQAPEEQEEEDEDLPPQKPKQKIAQGVFNLNAEEMSLAVNALASSQEFKIYQQVMLGQRIFSVIQSYQQYVQANKDDVSEEENEQ